MKGTTSAVKVKMATPTNGGAPTIEMAEPYVVTVTIEGVCPIFFHRYNPEAVEAKGKAGKGSKAKKSDDLESYVYRTEDGNLALPGVYLVGSIVTAAKFKQDPRSSRKSAMDLYKAGVFSLTEFADLGVADWEYVDRRRVMVQRSAVTRERPALREGWRATFELAVQLPEYIDPITLHEVISNAGRLIGVADHRPTYGRFAIVGYYYE